MILIVIIFVLVIAPALLTPFVGMLIIAGCPILGNGRGASSLYGPPRRDAPRSRHGASTVVGLPHVTVHVGLHANAFLLSSEMGGGE